MKLDAEIDAVERRIARERSGIALLAQDWTEAARDALISKRSLFAIAAFGFVLGDALRPARAAASSRKFRLGGLLAGVAFTAVRARFGSPWALAEAAWRGWRSATKTEVALRDTPRTDA